MKLKNILAKIGTETEKGGTVSESQKKNEIYKKSILQGLTDDEIKNKRKEFRDTLNEYLIKILRAKNEIDIRNFLRFYNETYEKTDFSVKSVYGGTNNEKITNYESALKICENYCNKLEKESKK